MTVQNPEIPLSPQATALRNAVLAEYRFDAVGLALFENALLALTRADKCRAAIDREGETIPDRFGTPKAHPLLPAEVQNRTLFARFVRESGINLEEIKSVGRPAGK